MKKALAFFAALFITAIVSPITASALTISPPDLSSYARVYVNESKEIYVDYGSEVTVRWETNRMSSCSVLPLDQTGTGGQYVIDSVTENMQITLECWTTSGQRYLSLDQSASINVIPPTFDYLRDYVSDSQTVNSKKSNYNATLAMINQAEKAYNSGSIKSSQAFLLRSINSFEQQNNVINDVSGVTIRYENAVEYLSKVLPVRLNINPDGCSVTATGPTGLTLDYGSHELGIYGTIYAAIGIGPQYPIIYGYHSQVTILDEGEITQTIPARAGWITFGKVVGDNGLIYALDTKNVAVDCTSP